jgi:hypothetical protein
MLTRQELAANSIVYSLDIGGYGDEVTAHCLSTAYSLRIHLLLVEVNMRSLFTAYSLPIQYPLAAYSQPAEGVSVQKCIIVGYNRLLSSHTT